VHAYNDYVYPLLNRWLARGYAVVRTAYEGLGTPGVHPHLVGTSEGRSVLDMVRAARRLVDALRGRGTPVTYDKIPGASHGGSVLKGGASATAWVVSRFR
jgi:acetyl esterase/lipase